jgi:hypothetical protein
MHIPRDEGFLPPLAGAGTGTLTITHASEMGSSGSFDATVTYDQGTVSARGQWSAVFP